MTSPVRLFIAAILGWASVAAAPSPYDELAQTMLPPDRVREIVQAGTERMVQRLKRNDLPPEAEDEMRVELGRFLDKLVADGVFARPLVETLREKLTEQEAVTFTKFLQSSVGKKLLNGSIKVGADRERAQQAIKEAMQARSAELSAIVKRIAEKHRPPAR